VEYKPDSNFLDANNGVCRMVNNIAQNIAQNIVSENATALMADLNWFSETLKTRLAAYIENENLPEVMPPPEIKNDDSLYASIIQHYEMNFEEHLVFLLALIPHIQPQLLDPLFQSKHSIDRGYSEFGGVNGKMHGGFLPTGETALFILSGNDLNKRFYYQYLFNHDHFFAEHIILQLGDVPRDEPLYSGQLLLSREIIDLVTTGEMRKPDYSRDFPAKLITTPMQWEDLILSSGTREQLRELEAWIQHQHTLMNDWELGQKLRPGYKCLFYGPPGTGKTLTATLLGQRVGYDVYRISLSSVVSKYIGETEKNLENIFNRVESLRCILFFDEADALFGKRTSVSDAHDRYANQEIAYLLQRIEDFSGLAILASNFRSNMDDAFMRRFQAVVNFPMPGDVERKSIWQQSFSTHTIIDEAVDMDKIAGSYELSGGAIMNVVRYASLMALEKGSSEICEHDLMGGIRRELHKEGKTL
jgi:ATPase family associated with various cellular activities (AAA)